MLEILETKKWPAETAEALPCGNLGHGGFSWAEQERKLHIKSFADTRAGCFQFLGYPDSLGGLISRVPLTRPWLIAN